MKSLCITGNTSFGVDQLARAMARAGAHPARPAQRSPEVSMADWHQAVFAERLGGQAATPAPVSLGRVWEQLAGDIFLANRASALWFWADTRSTALLDFWQEFDTNTRFALVYTDPAAALTHAVLHENATDNTLDELLDAWLQATRQMLRFHLRHPARSVVVSGAGHNNAEWMTVLAERLGVHPGDGSGAGVEVGVNADAGADAGTGAGSGSGSMASGAAEHSALARHLVCQYLEHHPQALAMHEEAQACVTTLEAGPTLIAPLSAREALACLLREQVHEKQQASAQYAALQSRVHDATEENELLLEQLHVVQEELEKAFEWKGRAQDHEKAAQTLRTETDALKARADSLDGQLKKAQADLKAANDKVSTLDAQLKKAQAEAKTAADDSRKVNDLQSRLKDTTEENELLLEQLHMVQEELERYYLNLKQAEADNARLEEQRAEQEKRMARVYAREPNYRDCEKMSVSALPSTGGMTQAEWRLEGLETGGRFVPVLRVRTWERAGAAGVTILREGAGDAPLQRWPAAQAQATELSCTVSPGGPFEGGNLVLSSLTPADWAMLKSVVVYLVGVLDAATPGALPPGVAVQPLKTGLAHFAKALHEWPAVMRFNDITITPVTSIPNYAGLDIHLGGLALGERRIPALQYRLASVDTEPGQFGQHPRLEFPESCRSALASWFAESSDERGERLELRFAKPNSVDVNVWNKLAGADQTLVAAVMSALPMQLAALEGIDTPHGQTGRDWTALSSWMVQTLAASVRSASRPAAGKRASA